MEDVNGSFMISDIYNTLCGFNEEDYDIDWKRIWKLKVLERVRYFVWLMKHGRILLTLE
jgi:hypothetical protein